MVCPAGPVSSTASIRHARRSAPSCWLHSSGRSRWLDGGGGGAFGGQIVCELPLPGVPCPGSGRIWVIDSHASSPPTEEDYDAAIERLLRA